MKRIAVIDDGIYKCKETQSFVSQFLEFDSTHKCFKEQHSFIRKFSHGTCCAMIIKKYCPVAEVVSLKILHQNMLIGSTEGLLYALTWCKNNDIDIVNLSLGTTNIYDFKSIQNTVNELIKNKTLIVAAVCNDFQFTVPAIFENVIGIASITKNNLSKTELAFLGINIQANSVHEIMVENQKYITPDCNSYATPYVVACLINGYINLEEKTTFVNDAIYITGYMFNQVQNGKIIIDFSKYNVNFTCNKKKYISIGVKGKNPVGTDFVDDLISENVPIAIIKNMSLIKKRDLGKMSHLIGCDVLIYGSHKEINKADYVIIYTGNHIIIKKKILFIWLKITIINENQLIKTLLKEIYGG